MIIELYGGWMDGQTYELSSYAYEIRIPLPNDLTLNNPVSRPDSADEFTRRYYATYTEFEKGKYKLTGVGY